GFGAADRRSKLARAIGQGCAPAGGILLQLRYHREETGRYAERRDRQRGRCMTSLLSDRSIVALSGPDARTLLQGLITNDIDNLAPDRPIYAALLTPQGKILFDFLISEGDGAVLLDCAAASA